MIATVVALVAVECSGREGGARIGGVFAARGPSAPKPAWREKMHKHPAQGILMFVGVVSGGGIVTPAVFGGGRVVAPGGGFEGVFYLWRY